MKIAPFLDFLVRCGKVATFEVLHGLPCDPKQFSAKSERLELARYY
jgi:hypothetical protein